MAAKRFAVVDAEGVVRNIILIEPGAEYAPAEGFQLREATDDDEIAPVEIPL